MGEISIDPKFNIHETYKKVRILNPYRNSGAPASLPLIFTINTNLGTGASMAIPTYFSWVYDYEVNWGDGATTSGHTANASHNYAAHGVYTLEITGIFPQFYFNNTGDKTKITSIDQWGSINYSTIQNETFFSLIRSNINSIADDISWINLVTNAEHMFYYANLTSLPATMTLDSLQYNVGMFYKNNLTALPPLMRLDNLVNGNRMFIDNALTDLPSGITFPKLINGDYMFRGSTFPTNRYSQLLIDMESNNTNTGVKFHAGNSKYNASGQTARNALVARGWVFTDGGLAA